MSRPSFCVAVAQAVAVVVVWQDYYCITIIITLQTSTIIITITNIMITTGCVCVCVCFPKDLFHRSGLGLTVAGWGFRASRGVEFFWARAYGFRTLKFRAGFGQWLRVEARNPAHYLTRI